MSNACSKITDKQKNLLEFLTFLLDKCLKQLLRYLINCFSSKLHKSTHCLGKVSVNHSNNITCVLFMLAWGPASTLGQLTAERSQSWYTQVHSNGWLQEVLSSSNYTYTTKKNTEIIWNISMRRQAVWKHFFLRLFHSI